MEVIDWENLSDNELFSIGNGPVTGKNGSGTVEERIVGNVAREILRGRRLIERGQQFNERAAYDLRKIEEG